MLGLVSSCDDDGSDLPEVSFKLNISGGTQNTEDNKIHVTKGVPLVINSLEVTPTNGNETILGTTTYYLNGMALFQTYIPPFAARFETAMLTPGDYIFQIQTNVYQVDKTAAVCVLSYDLVIDAPNEEQPDDDDASDNTIVTAKETTLAVKDQI